VVAACYLGHLKNFSIDLFNDVCSVVHADVTPPQFTIRLEPVTVVKGENTKLLAAMKGHFRTFIIDCFVCGVS